MKQRRQALLLYLWKLIPVTTDNIHYPDGDVRIDLYHRFLKECEESPKETDIIDAFRDTYRMHGYPWQEGNDLSNKSGWVWVTTFVRAAIKLRTGVLDAKSKDLGEIWSKVQVIVKKKV